MSDCLSDLLLSFITGWQGDLCNLTSLRQLFADDVLILSSDF